MKYEKQLLNFIRNQDNDGMMKWIGKQPLLDQPEILRELNVLAHMIAEANGKDLKQLVPEIDVFDEKINIYEDKILDEKLAGERHEMALDQQEKAMKEMNKAIDGVRAYVIECVVTDAPNAKSMRELAGKIIALEKKNGFYDPENWKALNL
jgi:uncharacterized coiled-coil DUF342 family protein